MTWVWFFAKVAVAIGIIMTVAPAMIVVERRVAGFIQGRLGPNRVGPFGTMQPLADIIKLQFKEQLIPANVDKVLYTVAPMLVFVPPTLAFAVIPFGNQIGDEKLQVVDLDIGVLFVMSVLSVAVYGITLGGWASNSKYSFLGALRASAQLISYELSFGLSILLVVMMSESLSLGDIVLQQANEGWNVFGGGNLWALPCGLIGFTMMYVCALAENNRLPFDLAECEAELVGGYHTEYSSMSFATFMFAEYVAMVVMSGLITTLYLGGWHFPGLTDPSDHSWLGGLLSFGVFMAKVLVLLFTYVWVRWTLPRFRYDQLMNLGWRSLLPISLANLAALAVIGVYLG